MKFLSTISPALVLPLVRAYLVSPPGVASPGSNEDCSEWADYSEDDTCGSISAAYGITVSEFESWNPITTELGVGCNLLPGLYYCVQINYESSNTSSSSSTTTTATSTSSSSSGTITSAPSTTFATTTTSGDGISTPSPIQTGLASDCDKFYLVVSGDECATIASDNGISLADFYAWNPAVGTSCNALDVGDYVCVDIIGVTPSSTTSTTSATDGITTPTPYQTGMVSNCDAFYLVQSGDECGTIASDYGVSLDDFYAWNPAVGTTCADLEVGEYVCVDVLGVTPTTTTTTTSVTTSGNGITTPTPYQTGMASDCDAFHLVVSGDECGTIASDYGVSLDDFYDWNPAVGTSCADLELGDYVCVDIIGVTPTTTTSNGITTPTPHQTGMVSDCDKFYLVVSGDECATIASSEGITVAEFYAWNPAVGTSCAYLDLGDYVCVGTE